MKNLLIVLLVCFVFALNAMAAVNLNTPTQAELESLQLGTSVSCLLIK